MTMATDTIGTAMSKDNGKTNLKIRDRSRTNKRWGNAARRASNELVRCHEQCRRQQERIETVLAEAEAAFEELKRSNRLGK